MRVTDHTKRICFVLSLWSLLPRDLFDEKEREELLWSLVEKHVNQNEVTFTFERKVIENKDQRRRKRRQAWIEVMDTRIAVKAMDRNKRVTDSQTSLAHHLDLTAEWILKTREWEELHFSPHKQIAIVFAKRELWWWCLENLQTNSLQSKWWWLWCRQSSKMYLSIIHSQPPFLHGVHFTSCLPRRE